MKKNFRNFGTLCMGLLLLAAAPLLPAQDPVWELSVSAPAEVYYSTDAPTSASFDASVSLWEAQTSGGGTGAPSDVQGFSFGVAHDPALLLATAAQVTTTSPAGAEPDFVDVGLYSDGFSAGVVFSFVGSWVLNYDTPTELATASYSLVEGPLSGASAPTSATIQKSDSLGVPPVASVVVVNGASIPLPDVPANLSLIPFTGSRFIRGDSTQDGNLDLADGIGILSYLFLGEPTTCLKALDMDQSNHVSISDGVQVLCSLFCEGSPAPSGPYPDCGVDIDSTLTCESFNVCP